jgi:hypothetical protein
MMQPMLPEHIVPDQPSGCSANQDIGGEMLLPQYASQTDALSHRIYSQLHPLRWILACDYCGQGPRYRAV